VVKIDCTWSKSLSLTNLTIVDLRPINKEQPFNKINALLDQLSKKWDQREGKPPPSASNVTLSNQRSFYSDAAVYRCYCKAFQFDHYAKASFLRATIEERVGTCVQTGSGHHSVPVAVETVIKLIN